MNPDIDTFSTVAPATTISSRGVPLRLVWNDEFGHDGLPDPASWNYEEGFVRNNEHQYYTRARLENARVENRRLVLEARREDFQTPSGIVPCTSGSITTAGKRSWTYGRFEIRAKVPRGRGTWPAIWMLGDNIRDIGWPRCGEIDIMEYVGFLPQRFHFTLHGPDANGAHIGTAPCNCLLPEAEDFAVYILEWEEDGFRYFVNGHQVAEFLRPDLPFGVWPFDKPHFLILNLAIGGGWGGQQGIDESIFPARFEVDYVRVYQK